MQGEAWKIGSPELRFKPNRGLSPSTINPLKFLPNSNRPLGVSRRILTLVSQGLRIEPLIGHRLSSKILLLLLFPLATYALPIQAKSILELENNYTQFLDWQASNNDESGVRIVTSESGNSVNMQINIVADGENFQNLAEPLSKIDNWCKFKSLHLNIKACVYEIEGEDQRITFYTGRKEYQTPKQAESLTLGFDSTLDKELLNVDLFAKTGPFGTKNYRIELDMISTGKGIYAEFRISQEINFLVRSAMSAYLNTIGRDKVGFTITGYDQDNNPVYVDGIQGMSERNLIRYLLAIDVYMRTLDDNDTDIFMKRAAMWFDATEKYALQLREVSREDYLDAKRREYDNQIKLQSRSIGDRPRFQ